VVFYDKDDKDVKTGHLVNADKEDKKEGAWTFRTLVSLPRHNDYLRLYALTLHIQELLEM